MPKGDEREVRRERMEKKKRARVVGGWGGGDTHSTQAMVADCSDNRLSSSVGLRGTEGEYKPAGLYLPTPPLWVCVLLMRGRGDGEGALVFSTSGIWI